MAVDQVEALADHGGGGLAVADQEELRRPWREGEAVLAEHLRLGHGAAAYGIPRRPCSRFR
jgi:hypothetical protein